MRDDAYGGSGDQEERGFGEKAPADEGAEIPEAASDASGIENTLNLIA